MSLDSIPDNMAANWWALIAVLIIVLGGVGTGLAVLMRAVFRLLHASGVRASEDIDKVLSLYANTAEADREASKEQLQGVCSTHEKVVGAICETHKAVAGTVQELALAVRDNSYAVRELTARRPSRGGAN